MIGAGGGEKLDARARELAAGDTTLTVTAEALLAARAALAAQVARLANCSSPKRGRIRLANG